MDAQTNKLAWATGVSVFIGIIVMTLTTLTGALEQKQAFTTGLIIGFQTYFYMLIASQYRILKKPEE